NTAGRTASSRPMRQYTGAESVSVCASCRAQPVHQSPEKVSQSIETSDQLLLYRLAAIFRDRTGRAPILISSVSKVQPSLLKKVCDLGAKKKLRAVSCSLEPANILETGCPLARGDDRSPRAILRRRQTVCRRDQAGPFAARLSI